PDGHTGAHRAPARGERRGGGGCRPLRTDAPRPRGRPGGRRTGAQPALSRRVRCPPPAGTTPGAVERAPTRGDRCGLTGAGAGAPAPVVVAGAGGGGASLRLE